MLFAEHHEPAGCRVAARNVRTGCDFEPTRSNVGSIGAGSNRNRVAAAIHEGVNRTVNLLGYRAVIDVLDRPSAERAADHVDLAEVHPNDDSGAVAFDHYQVLQLVVSGGREGDELEATKV